MGDHEEGLSFLKNTAIEDHGMVTLRRCGILNALRGVTTLEEILRVTMPDEVTPGKLKTEGVD